MESGFLYIARDQYVEEALASAKQLRRVMDNPNIALITDESIEEDIFDEIIVKDLTRGVSNKVFNIQESPFKKTVFLDTDIYIDQDISEIFDLLNRFDLVASVSQVRNTGEVQIEAFPEFNTGVLGYNDSEEFYDFQEKWADIFRRDYEGEKIADQPRFREALLESKLRISPLPREYNCRIGHAGQLCGDVKIFHGRLIDIPSTGLEKEFDVQKAAEKLNKTDLPRVFVPKSGRIKVLVDRKPYHRQIIDGIKQYGLKESFRRGLNKLTSTS